MSFKNLAVYSVISWIILIPLKIWIFNNEIFANAGFEQLFFWAIICLVSISLVRRIGVINFFESFFVIFIWFVGGLFFDLVITSRFTGNSIFSKSEYWYGFLMLGLSVFLFHKKRHIHVRHELHAKAHAAAHPHDHGHGSDGDKH